MANEPPSPVTPPTVRSSYAAPTLIDPSTGYPHFSQLSANSGSLHNRAIRSLSLHMQIGGGAFVMNVMNNLKLYDHSKYLSVLGSNRPKNQSLITVSNHQSTIDDPALLAAVTPYKVMTDIYAARWGWCARELCFSSKFLGWFFLHGKIVPIVRGQGLFQRGVDEATEHIARGESFHVFPEGKCIPVARGIAPLRWGVGKLVADAYRNSRRCEEMKAAFAASSAATAPTDATPATTSSFSSSSPASSSFSAPCPLPPLLLPFVHHGMPRVMPFYQLPKHGHTVRCIFGDTIDCEDLVDFHERNEHNRLAFDYPLESDLYVAITDRIFDRLVSLDKQLTTIEFEEGDQIATEGATARDTTAGEADARSS